jgi:hypothetical protein
VGRRRRRPPVRQPFGTSTLDDAAKVDVVAFILQTNGFPAATRELVPGGLEAIQIVAQNQLPAVQNFSRVHIVGCLARSDANGWILTGASEPAAASDAAAAATAPGTGRVVLINAGQFDPVSHVGKRVEARGLVYRDDRETLLTVAALQPVGPC